MAIRTAHDGSFCDPYIAIDFDGNPNGGEHPITRRVADEGDLSSEQLKATDMRYVTCAEAKLVAEEGASVGLLRKGERSGVKECAAAASGASIGGALDITDDAKPIDDGFEEGASLCAVTSQGTVARATIDRIVYNAGIADSIPTVEFKLTTWGAS
ncbi:hypothetical protein [Streptomyces cacaoi]|nr:hypothetical protein [Streptomyces cacaoi]NNG87593.1 hypothetical protein [Streptomyces cacaoi]